MPLVKVESIEWTCLNPYGITEEYICPYCYDNLKACGHELELAEADGLYHECEICHKVDKD